VHRRLTLAVAPLALVAVAAAPSLAAPKQVKKSYTATAPVPDVTVACDGAVPMSVHDEPFTAPANGKLAVKMVGGDLDWDLYLWTPEREELAKDFTLASSVASLTLKMTKGQQLLITACNVGAVGDAAMSYVFTYAK
jgi:hypothetical protein